MMMNADAAMMKILLYCYFDILIIGLVLSWSQAGLFRSCHANAILWCSFLKAIFIINYNETEEDDKRGLLKTTFHRMDRQTEIVTA